MHSLRSSVLLARLLLVWFALTLGVAGASPFINPQSMELVCSTGGEVKLVVTQGSNDDETSKAQALGLHTLDCSLCLATMLPPTQISTEFAKAAAYLASYKKPNNKLNIVIGKTYLLTDGTPIIFYDDEIQIGFDTFKYSDFAMSSFLENIKPSTKKIIIDIYTNSNAVNININ